MDKFFTRLMLAGAAFAVAGSLARAQPPAPSGQEPNISPAEVQRMFDAYAWGQAQEQLRLNDDQFARFLGRFKALQEVRRRTQLERGRILRELVQMSRQDDADETAIRDRLKELKDVDARSAVEIKNAYDAVDQVLDLRQQARFRVFEEFIERRKIELLTAARRNNRLKNRQ
jgi:Spy/CpxP family protein refolding chaperone